MSIGILQSRLSWSIQLRWLAIVGFFLATITTKYIFELALPFETIWQLLVVLTVINLSYVFVLKIFKEFTFLYEIIFLTLHIVIDLIILTVLIHLSGGVENPVYLFYIFHVVLSSIVLPRWYPYVIATFVIILFSGLVYSEYTMIVPHYCIFNTDTHENLALIILVLIIFAVTVFITTYICTTFMKIFRQSKREIDSLNRKLVKADQQKTQFFQYSSHELKSPIVAIKSSIDGVIANYSDKIDERPLSVLKRASIRSTQMLNILKELLELSRNRTLAPQVYTEKVEINKILNQAIERETENADVKNIKFAVDIEKGDPYLTGKISDFEKIFDNLIGNAVRYNREKGEVKVSSESNNNLLKIVITDSGIGIPPKDLENIFAEFYRSENAKKVVNFGTGLGLSLVKQIIENYTGRIEVSSKIDIGTTFTIYLPIKGK
ncbi:MAG: sensor histidine kinase [Calditrichaeota bacterium]|nr:sensor histidine kinase [Calditrichota bacterium]